MNNLAIFGPGFKDFDQFLVGFDNKFDRLYETGNAMLKSAKGYPPYNILREGDKYKIEMAVAGFSQEDITINVVENKLTIVGTHTSETKKSDAIFRGIANRSFSRSFVIDDYIQVIDAEMKNGMLTIMLERVVPEHMRPRKIEIKRLDGPQLLNETNTK